MFKTQIGYVETDPSGRYGRFREVLGKGAMKTVYRAFDEVLGMEVAWNQVKINDVFRSPDELQRLYSEVHLLKSLSHDSIIHFYLSWIDIERRTFNFITEMFTSGTLREYRQKYQRVHIRAIKNWSRQILRGLAYLHGHDPPVIHRDLKCDNIFVNGHLGQVKIGDLGLAAILHGSKNAHSVIGTPEFMAPELYEEDYNELVDVYSFGMCVLEMLTGEYPYSECSNPAQIYKKVTSGKLPGAFYKMQDVEAQRFVGKCLENVSTRLPAKQLLLDPFLASDEGNALPIPRVPSQKLTPKGTVAELMRPVEAYPTRSTDMSITGTMDPHDDTIFLKVQISEKNGHARNIYFPFDIVNDTATDVALEMVKELEIEDWEPLEIADMIEEEVSSLVPNWKEWSNLQIHHQHSFKYGENDDLGEIHHPFYVTSSHSSSDASLPVSSLSYDDRTFSNTHPHEDVCRDDDLSSNSSGDSFNYSSMKYEDNPHSSDFGAEPLCTSKTLKSTRFQPDESKSENDHKQFKQQLNSWMPSPSSNRRKPTRVRSVLDIRSQLLQRSLLETSKRRLFKTIAGVENIGFHGPSPAPRRLQR